MSLFDFVNQNPKPIKVPEMPKKKREPKLVKYYNEEIARLQTELESMDENELLLWKDDLLNKIRMCEAYRDNYIEVGHIAEEKPKTMKDWVFQWNLWLDLLTHNINKNIRGYCYNEQAYWIRIQDFGQNFNPLWYKGPDATSFLDGLYGQLFAEKIMMTSADTWFHNGKNDVQLFNWHLYSYRWSQSERDKWQKQMDGI